MVLLRLRLLRFFFGTKTFSSFLDPRAFTLGNFYNLEPIETLIEPALDAFCECSTFNDKGEAAVVVLGHFKLPYER